MFRLVACAAAALFVAGVGSSHAQGRPPAAPPARPAPPVDTLTLAEQANTKGYLGVAVVKERNFDFLKIVEIDPVGPAGILGLKVGDLIHGARSNAASPDGQSIISVYARFDNVQALRDWLNKYPKGGYHFLDFTRFDGARSATSQEAKVYLDTFPDQAQLAAVTGGPGAAEDAPPLVPTLAAALQSEPPRPTAAETADFAEQWGVLARLAPRVYMKRLGLAAAYGDRQGSVLDSDVCTTFITNTGCTVTIWWHRPGRVLARSWYTDYGTLVATDAIMPTATPGIFKVRRRYTATSTMAEFEIVATYNQLIEAGQRYSLDPDFFPSMGQMGDDPTNYLLTTAEGSGLQPYKRAEAARRASETVTHMARLRDNAERERRRAQRAETMAAIYQGLQVAGAIAEQGRLESEASLNATIARAQQQGDQQVRERLAAQQQAIAAARQGTNGGGPRPTQNAQATQPATVAQRPVQTTKAPARAIVQAPPPRPPQPAASAAGPVRYYLFVGLTPGPNNTRNPLCYSNVLTASIDRRAPGASGRADQAASVYEASFLAKCSRLGRVEGGAQWDFEGFNPGWRAPQPHPEDKVVQLP